MGARRRASLPRWAAIILGLFTWLVLIPLAHGALPWALSRPMPRYGWEAGSPGLWNWFGIIPVALSAAVLMWVLAVGLARTPDRVELSLTPSFLLLQGPYRFSRNPMYVAELGLWLGWALFFGSAAVLVGSVVLWSLVAFVILPREERSLETAFGQKYRDYKCKVPRWLGIVPRSARKP